MIIIYLLAGVGAIYLILMIAVGISALLDRAEKKAVEIIAKMKAEKVAGVINEIAPEKTVVNNSYTERPIKEGKEYLEQWEKGKGIIAVIIEGVRYVRE